MNSRNVIPIIRGSELFSVLRVLVDRPASRSRFLILGSASPALVRGASETLAGRIEFVELGGFDLLETGADALDLLWPRVAIADLKLTHLWVIYPGRHRFPMDRRLTAWPLCDVAALPRELSARRR